MKLEPLLYRFNGDSHFYVPNKFKLKIGIWHDFV
jgi:hypothetical protein